MIDVTCVVGARPNFIKIAPLMKELRRSATFRVRLVHTGQHYDYQMNESFFEQLEIPAPDCSLAVGSGSHAKQTADIMAAFDAALDRADVMPRCVVVVGDVNSTLACTLVAAKRGIPVAHVEAGLRSFDRSMPEEINRVVTDQLSDRLYVTERKAIDNLVREGIERQKIVFVGNVMVDTLLASLDKIVSPERVLQSHGVAGNGVDKGSYAVLTLHRPSNVDSPETLRSLCAVLSEIAKTVPIIFPMHPRTRAAAEKNEHLASFLKCDRVIALPPVSYLEMVSLVNGASVVLTDSGGVQEETTVLGVPCITLRENTERPVTIAEGSNVLAGTNPVDIKLAFDRALGRVRQRSIPELWDGDAAVRIVDDLQEWLATGAD